MLKNTLKRRAAAAAIAIAAVTGLGAVTAAPANAYSYTYPRHCNWPAKSGISISGVNSGVAVRIDAYSPTGYRLGSMNTSGSRSWYTPWEDVTYWVFVNDSTVYLATFCY